MKEAGIYIVRVMMGLMWLMVLPIVGSVIFILIGLSSSLLNSIGGQMGNILHLTLKKKWFDMIASGEKKEEYREMKPYWHKRLLNKHYDVISFRNSYYRNSPKIIIEFKELISGLGILEWGGIEGVPVYIIKLGKILVR